jgi:hypothetical protein
MIKKVRRDDCEQGVCNYSTNKSCVSDLPCLSYLGALENSQRRGYKRHSDAFVTPVKWTFDRNGKHNQSLKCEKKQAQRYRREKR